MMGSDLPPTRSLGITDRIRALASYVQTTTRVFVDIGTNHALLPIAVLRAGRAQRCIGVDRSAHALSEGERRLRRSPDLAGIELRLGDGLSVVAADELDVLSIAGMGPRLMTRILEQGLALLQQAQVRLLLNPFGGTAEPRAFLARHGFELQVDVVIAERGRSYDVLVAQRVC